MNRNAALIAGLLVLLSGSLSCVSRAQDMRGAAMPPWSSQIQSLNPKWVVGRTYHFATRIQPTDASQVTGSTRPDLPVAAVVAFGNGKVGNFSAVPWKPGKSNILTIRYDYTPLGDATGRGHVINLLTRQKRLAATITHHSTRP